MPQPAEKQKKIMENTKSIKKYVEERNKYGKNNSARRKWLLVLYLYSAEVLLMWHRQAGRLKVNLKVDYGGSYGETASRAWQRTSESPRRWQPLGCFSSFCLAYVV